MDEIDLIILNELRENSRLTYRELGELSNMTVSAVHKRIKRLEEDGVITAYIARINRLALNCLTIVIFGTSNARSTDAVCKELGQHESIFTTAIASGKFLYISAMLRNISELQDYSSYVSRTAQINDPNIAILNVAYTSIPEPLTRIDYKILKSLNRDARKPIIDVSDETGLSAKTVRKRLDRMIEHNLASFSIEWTPLYTDSFVSIFHIELNEGTNIKSTIKHINEKYSQNIAVIASFSNIPNFILLEIWAKTARDSRRIQEELQTEGFKDVIQHVLLSIGWYEFWVDQLLRTK
ncbi:MAG: winged helix-turn-helix transcriptional regulator [Candidatus Lokiarchaeota archaeon]|nr:winged helix-turn-helix transcriptional regulator [Candidatus Lokiarchaeota archaeon]